MIKRLDEKNLTDPFEILDRNTIQSIENPISLAIWVYSQSMPENWSMSETEIKNHFKIGKDRYLKALKELRRLGLYEFKTERDEKGIIVKKTFVSYPKVSKPSSIKEPDFGEKYTIFVSKGDDKCL